MRAHGNGMAGATRAMLFHSTDGKCPMSTLLTSPFRSHHRHRKGSCFVRPHFNDSHRCSKTPGKQTHMTNARSYQPEVLQHRSKPSRKISWYHTTQVSRSICLTSRSRGIYTGMIPILTSWTMRRLAAFVVGVVLHINSHLALEIPSNGSFMLFT